MRSSARHKRFKLKSEINVVPYIDVMLVLLIIFMVTTPMLNSNVDVNLPQADAKALKNKKDPIIISVDSQGNLFLTVGTAPKEPIDEDTMKLKVGAFVKADPDANVIVAGDREGKYDKVFQVMADLENAGVSKVGLMGAPDSGTKNGRP
jgi:biopolymer transport protein TolR